MIGETQKLSLPEKRFVYSIAKDDLRHLYSKDEDLSPSASTAITRQLGPLQPIFAEFIENERHVQPLSNEQLQSHFVKCGDPRQTVGELLQILRDLAPGNGHIGHEQVVFLTKLLQAHVAAHLAEQGASPHLLPHDHAFGSGGDLQKTIHATTTAAIVAAPKVPICKTGTLNVTSFHGSSQVMDALGYSDTAFDSTRINEQLARFGFAFASLATLGFPYSENLREARRLFWEEAKTTINDAYVAMKYADWQAVVRSTAIATDIFKVISPNAQVLSPEHHSTGVCYHKMLPYVIGIYLHLDTQGMIVYSYDGIDEIANGSTNMTPNAPNTVLIKVEADRILITELAPEDLEMPRAQMVDIAEKEELTSDANIFWRILDGREQGPKRDFILANAGMIIAAHQEMVGNDLISHLRAGIAVARDLIDDGTAENNYRALLKWREEQPKITPTRHQQVR